MHFGDNHRFSGHLVLKMQHSCFPFCPRRRRRGAWEHWRKEERWAEDQKGFSKLLKLPSYCRKLTVHGHNENIKNVGSVFTIISPVCFVLHIVELHMKLQPWVQTASGITSGIARWKGGEYFWELSPAASKSFQVLTLYWTEDWPGFVPQSLSKYTVLTSFHFQCLIYE